MPHVTRMKILFFPVYLVALLLLLARPASATPLDDRISELKHALKKEATAKAAAMGANAQGGFGNPGMSPAFIDASIDQMMAQMENPAYGGNIDGQLAQLTSVFTSEEVQEATTNLLNEVRKERKDKADAEVTDLKALIARAAQDITQAKKPEDLDALITEMGKHQNMRNGGNPSLQGNQELIQQFSSAFEFTKQWQNYLAHVASGQTDQAHNDVQSLSQNNYGVSLIPRSKLLALAAPEKITAPNAASATSTPVAQAQAILNGMKTLDDIEPALAKLAPLRQADMAELQNMYINLSQLLQSYRNLKAGLPAQFNVNYGFDGGPSIPAELRAQLLVFALQNRFTSFQGKPPTPSEKPADFVNRVIADATSREDWDLLYSAAEARGSLQQNMGVGFATSYPNGIDSVIAGAHQESAGQFALAVQSYEIALRSNDPAVPAKIIGDKLAAIQRDHPQDYEAGMQIVISPPAPRYYQGPGTPSRPNALGSPGLTNQATAPIPPSLLSPAANSNAAAPTPSAPPK